MEQIVSLEHFDWNKIRGALSVSSELFAGSFPKTIKIKSHKTGKIVEFRQSKYNEPGFDEDGFDGIQMGYVPVKGGMYVKVLFVYHTM